MAKVFIQNTMQRPFILAAVAAVASAQEPVNIEAGTAEAVDSDHWNAAKKGNTVIDALLAGQYLRVTTDEPKTMPAKQLDNPASPEAPATLTGETTNPKLERKQAKTVELEVDPASDEPAAGKGRK